MTEQNTSRAIRYLPHVVVATTAVAVMPAAVVWWMRAGGVVSSVWACVGLAIALSLAASLAGSAYWKRCRGSGDVFFSELLLWGWLHRLRGERRLAKTAGILGLADPDQHLAMDEHSVEHKAHLLRQMAAALDAQDPYTDGHSRRVALHCVMVARKLGLGRTEILKVRTAAAVHDLGKLRIPLALLNKPDKLTEEEFEVVKRHPDEGAEIVSCMDDPEITAMVRHHHERFDGTGYPSGLEGEETPLGARIIAVADTFDALTSLRPYRKATAHKRALEAIIAVSGTQLDPVVVRAFLRCYSGNRAVLFWTLLAVSPQRALAWVRGKGSGRGNLASAATVATPAALAAVVAAAFGSTGAVTAAHPPVRLAQRLSASKAPTALAAKRHYAPNPSSPANASAMIKSPSKQAVLGVRRTRGASRPAPVNHVRQGGSGGGSRTGGGGSHSGGSRGGWTPTSTSSKPVANPIMAPPTPSVTATPMAGIPATPAGTASSPGPATTPPPPGPATTSPSPDPATTPPPDPGGPAGGGGTTPGSTGGGNGGTSGGGPATGPGSGGSSGGSSGGGSGEPLTKDRCKNGGYATYHFPNQGQCVSYAEHQSHS